MEIRNNQQYYNRQNFGMAFRLPEKKSAQDAFANLVSNYGEKPYNVVERSLTSLIEKHANDKHFDFTCLFRFVNNVINKKRLIF